MFRCFADPVAGPLHCEQALGHSRNPGDNGWAVGTEDTLAVRLVDAKLLKLDNPSLRP